MDSQESATGQGDACGHAVDSVQSVVGRESAADAEDMASGHQVVGCIGQSMWFESDSRTNIRTFTYINRAVKY